MNYYSREQLPPGTLHRGVEMRRIASIVLVSLVAAGLVSAPAAATGEQVDLQCFGYAPFDTSVDVIATIKVDGSAYTGSATLAVSATPADDSSWTTSTVAVEDGDLWVPFDAWFHADAFGSFAAKLTVGDTTMSCAADYAPVLVDYSGTLSVPAGGKVNILADLVIADYLASKPNMPQVDLQVDTASGWVTVGSAAATKYGNFALLEFQPVSWSQARLRVRDDNDSVVGLSETFLIDVTYAHPTVTAKSTSVVQSTNATATARIGNHLTTGTAYLQRKSGSTWVTVTSQPITAGSATFTWTQKATTSYRILMTPTGKTAVATSTFAVTYVPAVSAKPAATSAKSGSTVAVSVTHRLTSVGSGTLQYYSSGAWHTYKTFALSSSGTTKTSLKVSATHTWRVMVGSYASAQFTVTKR